MTILTTHNGKYPSSIFPSYELPLWSITGKPKHRTDTRQQLVPRAFLPPHISEANATRRLQTLFTLSKNPQQDRTLPRRKTNFPISIEI
jgi:hypothetical protein